MSHKAADRFGIDRLKKLCEQEMMTMINIESVPYIFLSADRYNAEVTMIAIIVLIITEDNDYDQYRV